jgi:hypothetical protein
MTESGTTERPRKGTATGTVAGPRHPGEQIDHRAGRAMPPLPGMTWVIDPTEFALDSASWYRSRALVAKASDETSHEAALASRPPRRACTEAGRRMLLLQFEFSEWVLRRVDKVEFVSGSRVLRRTTIELAVPDTAPVVVVGEGDQRRTYWLVPVSVMRRRTLVNLDLRDESGGTVRMLGLRFTQALDEAMLRAAAQLALGDDSLSPALENLIHRAVSGTRSQVEAAKLGIRRLRGEVLDEDLRDRALDLDDEQVRTVLRNDAFAAALERLWHNFTLYTLLDTSLGRQRLLRMTVDEPTHWRLQEPKLEQKRLESGTHIAIYRPFEKPGRLPWGSALGWNPVRLRFLTPSAENCASYHFEFTAPPGVRIARATLLAGRPQQGAPGTVGRGVSLDDHVPYGPTAGLHAVEVPNGSLCRAQIDLRVSPQGWLSTLLIAAFACLVVVLSVAVHAMLHMAQAGQWSPDQVTNIVLLLVTVSAGSATYVAHQHAHEVVTTMVRMLRITGGVMMGVPAALAGILLYASEEGIKTQWPSALWGLLWASVAVSAVCLVVVAAAFLFAWRSEREARRRTSLSSWDLADLREVTKPDKQDDRTFLDALEDLHFSSRAIGFFTAEGWHERHGWSDRRQDSAVRSLRSPGLLDCGCEDGAH